MLTLIADPKMRVYANPGTNYSQQGARDGPCRGDGGFYREQSYSHSGMGGGAGYRDHGHGGGRGGYGDRNIVGLRDLSAGYRGHSERNGSQGVHMGGGVPLPPGGGSGGLMSGMNGMGGTGPYGPSAGMPIAPYMMVNGALSPLVVMTCRCLPMARLQGLRCILAACPRPLIRR